MALTQRLEFRQSQSLVMTPQLMQAIKLLQLSNLDLTTIVEEELERNPLLERASDEPAGREAPAEAGQCSDSDESGGSHGDEAGTGEAFEPGQEEWLSRDLGTRAEIEQTLDTGLDNVFSEEPAEAAARNAQDAAPSVYTEWGGGASGTSLAMSSLLLASTRPLAVTSIASCTPAWLRWRWNCAVISVAGSAASS